MLLQINYSSEYKQLSNFPRQSGMRNTMCVGEAAPLWKIEGNSNPDPTSVVTFGVVVGKVKLELFIGGKSIPYGYL